MQCTKISNEIAIFFCWLWCKIKIKKIFASFPMMLHINAYMQLANQLIDNNRATHDCLYHTMKFIFILTEN